MGGRFGLPDWHMAIAWLVTIAIGMLVYFYPISRLLDQLSEQRKLRAGDKARRTVKLLDPQLRPSPGTSQHEGAMVGIRKVEEAATVFDPELIQVLVSALDDAWNRIEKSGSRFARPGYARAMREVLAKRLIETAQQGLNDPIQLADDAVQFFSVNYADGRVAELTS